MNKELTIVPPEGYCIDESKSTFEKIVFKPIDTKPRSWKEYCFQRSESEEKGFYINEDSGIESSKWPNTWVKGFDYWRNVLPSKELAEAFLAMMQLISLRQAWIGNWKPDWKDIRSSKWSIIYSDTGYSVDLTHIIAHTLSFPTKEMATDFMNCFKDLLEQAKILL